MDFFNFKDGRLFAENIPVADIANSVGTPCYVYSRATLERHWKAFDQALSGYDHLICYAVKANSSLAVLNILARLGSGFDIVSVGELERVISAGGDPNKIVFSGVGKQEDEIKRALQVGIYCFNVESESELVILNRIAGLLNIPAAISIRVNPDVDAKTHPYIATGLKENKFGIAIKNAHKVYQFANTLENLKIIGIDCHIGSQLTAIDPFIDSLDRVLALADDLNKSGINIHHLDLGGGLGIRYKNETPPGPFEFAEAISNRLKDKPYKIILEPGRAIAGNAGILLTKVLHIKHNEDKNFAIVDAAMNDLIRPALYDAWLTIEEDVQHDQTDVQSYDIVGPICETGDFIGKDRKLTITENSLLVVRSAGAYGFSMSSNYNSRPRAAEVIVDNNKMYTVRQRETIEDLMRGECVIPE